MKVLMFGWEFPPYKSGGLGTACYGLTKSLNKQGEEITFVLPRTGSESAEFVKLISTYDLGKVKVKTIDSPVSAYMTKQEYFEEVLRYNNGNQPNNIYGKNLFVEVERYASKAGLIAQMNDHDVIHAHDWMTAKAAMVAKEVSGRPFIFHVHATEFDRTGGNGVNQLVYDIERMGMHAADRIIAVSNFTKNKIVEHYGVDPENITVVHNGVEFNDNDFGDEEFALRKNGKVVLFLGRITLQKGPDYFVKAARKVLDFRDDVTFVIVGSGDMHPALIKKVAENGMADKVLFTGFLRGAEVDRAYQMADLYVMPSVSEPFGLTPLEAMRNNVPVLISKQSGVSEVLAHALKADFWDVDEMANKIVGVLEHPVLHGTLQQHGKNEVENLGWDKPASMCREVYRQVVMATPTIR